MARIIDAFKAFWQVLRGGELVPGEQVNELRDRIARLSAAPKPEPRPDRFHEGAVYALLLLQREGRLVDFLQENLDGYADDQIGAAVRQIHKDCAKALSEYFGIQRVVDTAEGESVQVPAPLDPTLYKLSGNVPDEAPYRGAVRHQGWKAARLNLPERTGKINEAIIQPAEVEI